MKILGRTHILRAKSIPTHILGSYVVTAPEKLLAAQSIAPPTKKRYQRGTYGCASYYPSDMLI